MKLLAQLNIARLKYDLEDERVSDFVSNLGRVNAIAERSEGFVWMMHEEDSSAIAIQGFDDPRIISNLSVWENAEALEKFVWQTVHKKMYNRKGEWFEPGDQANLVMWWIDQGHRPSLEEAVERLEYLRANGPSDYAFGWSELPSAELYKSQQCA